MTPSDEPFRLFVLAIAIACIAPTVTHEEIFREPRAEARARNPAQ
jgi:hypothetical protein